MIKPLFLSACLISNLYAIAGPLPDKGSTQRKANTAMPQTSLLFIENKGQITDQNHAHRTDIQYSLPAANGLNIFIGNGAIHYQFNKPDKQKARPVKGHDMAPNNNIDTAQINYAMYRMDVTLEHANPNAELIAEEKDNYFENYYTTATGPDGAIAHTCRKITYKNIYPHIDWILYVKAGQLKHEFIINEGGKPGDIQIRYGGAGSLALNADGALVATTPLGNITEDAPSPTSKTARK